MLGSIKLISHDDRIIFMSEAQFGFIMRENIDFQIAFNFMFLLYRLDVIKDIQQNTAHTFQIQV